MEKNDAVLSGIDVYNKGVFKLLIVGVSIIAMTAGLTFTIIKLLGFYPDVSSVALGIFDATTVLYFAIALILRKKCFDKNGDLVPKVVNISKWIVLAIVIVQWNFITYMIPSREFWAFFPFFILVTVFFLDKKLTLASIASLVISIIVSWVIRGEALLPVRNDYFVAELILRCVAIFLISAVFIALSLILEKVLVGDLEKLADIDALTHLRSRRTLNANMMTAMKEADNANKPLSVFMCDIDDFKKTNDTYGHACGDEVLKNIANIFLHVIHDRGQVYRFGGEEILALVNLDLKEAMELAKQVKDEVGKSVVAYNGEDIKVTITIGVAEYKKGLSIDEFIKHADANLYYGKNHGKNVVIS